jgi:predicted protein tyrosine phosphatase
MIVCPLHEIEAVIEARGATHLLTLIDPATVPQTPRAILAERHLKLGVNDITEVVEGLVCPDESTVEAVLAFGRGWDGEAPLVVHCWAGISRSTAAAFMIACARNPSVAEARIARELRRRSPWAYPNRRLVALADAALGREGRMVEAAEAMGPPDFGDGGDQMGRAFDLPARF